MNPSGREQVPDKAVFLVTGNEEFLVSRRARAVVDAWCPPEQQALGLEIIAADSALKVEDAVTVLRNTLEALKTPGLFGGSKTVWLRDAAFLADAALLRAPPVKDGLIRLAGLLKTDWPGRPRLVLSAPGIDKRQTLYRACRENGAIEEYARPEKTYQAEKAGRDRLAELLRRARLRISGEDMDRLLEKAGIDTRQLDQEVEKLSLALGPGATVERRHIEELVSSSRESMGWALADAALQRDLPGCLKAIESLSAQRENIVGMLTFVERGFRQMELMKQALARGWARHVRQDRWQEVQWSEDPGIAESCALLGRDDPRALHPYRAAKLAEQAGRFSAGELCALRTRMTEIHEQIVSRNLPPRLLLERLCIEIALPSRESRPATSQG